ncbi:hypothetical protein ACOSQ3_005769 [Xanthoceras sorbifolium]
MSTAQVSQVSDKSGEMRRTADFPPSIWGDRFINLSSEQAKLNLIDSIERLGVGHHFEAEIRQGLQMLCNAYDDDAHEYDLYTVALSFRLLRQHGHHVSCDIFNKFKDDKGNFKESLASDVSGTLSLYEAAYVGVHGEDILEEAIAFTTDHLQSMATHHLTSPHLAAQVLHALRKPLHKCVPRIEARRYISVYQDEASHNQALLKLAKLDFNLLQLLHKKEISQLCRWAKDLDFTGKLPFARDRMVEGYFWTLGMVPERQYSLARIIIAKAIHILAWDTSCVEQLPEYMQIIYKSFLDFGDEIEEELSKNGWPSYRVDYVKEIMKKVVRASLDEAKWINDITLDNTVTKETFDWVLSRPTVITSSELHFRLLDDIKTHKFEQERGHDISSVEIYMKEHRVSEQEAYKELQKLVKNAWKDVNKECLRLSDHDLPKPMLMFILNYPRIIYFMYEKDDFFTRVGKEMKTYVESLLIDPVPL